MVEISEVRSGRDLHEFIRLPWRIYRNDPNWVPPIVMDVRSTLDRKKSPFFEFGEAAYFLAKRDGQTVGRISAHVNRNHNEYHHTREGFFGFYECEDDLEVSRALLSGACDWVKNKGMTRIVGPENFTIYDEPCFMIDGWDADPPAPILMQNYNPAYYVRQMEDAGFGKEVDWYAFKVDGSKPIGPALLGAKDRMIERNGFVFRKLNLKKVDEEVAKIKAIFNDAWSENWGHVPFTERQIDRIKEALLLLIDPRICYMVETSDGQPIGCSITAPDINPFVKKMNGRVLPFGWLQLLYGRRHADHTRTLIMGVLPQYRHMGVDIALVVETITVGLSVGYKWSECSLIVENNERMIRPIEKWGGKRYKTYRLFSRSL